MSNLVDCAESEQHNVWVKVHFLNFRGVWCHLQLTLHPECVCKVSWSCWREGWSRNTHNETQMQSSVSLLYLLYTERVRWTCGRCWINWERVAKKERGRRCQGRGSKKKRTQDAQSQYLCPVSCLQPCDCYFCPLHLWSKAFNFNNRTWCYGKRAAI